VKKIHYLLSLAQDIGIGHLVLTRKIKSLTPSEYQRILLGRFLSFTGSGNLIILDEPSLGLGIEELKKLQIYLKKLRDFGNTLIIVDHSPFLQSKADYLIKMGPLSGSQGGQVISEDEAPKAYRTPNIVASKKIPNKKVDYLKLKNSSGYGLHFKEIKIPLKGITRVFGKTGSGKSTMILKVLGNLLHKQITGEDFFSLEGLKGTLGPLKEPFEKVLIFVSSEKKGNSRSTLGTYSGLSTFCRKHFSSLEISKKLGLKDGHFSPNSPIGKCLGCEGKGVKVVEMNFLEDLDFVCPDCQGKKLKPYVANIHDGNFTFSDAMELPMDQVLSKIRLTPKGLRIKELMEKLNIDYLSLGRPLTSLSGGEFQRIQLVSALSSPIRNSILFFENISSGLSYLELEKLGTFLQELSLLNNKIIIIDQNPELHKFAESSLIFEKDGVELLFH
jgi:excinuclease ABC subunit A